MGDQCKDSGERRKSKDHDLVAVWESLVEPLGKKLHEPFLCPGYPLIDPLEGRHPRNGVEGHRWQLKELTDFLDGERGLSMAKC